MEEIKLTFLGTGDAIPTKKRNHTSILASFANENILIDCGEGTQRQLRKIDLSPTKITRIFITHWHGDHILGLPGLFQTLALLNYQKTLKLYGPKGTKEFLQIVQSLIKRYKINLEAYEVSNETIIDEKDFKVEAKEMSHSTPAIAYSIILKDKIRLNKSKLKKFKLPNSPIIKELQAGKDITFNGKKIKASQVIYKEKGKKVTFVLDTYMNSNAVELARNSDLLVTESSFHSKDLEKAKEYKHLTARHAAEIAKKSKSRKLLLTHISQRYENNMNIIEKEAKKTFKNTKLVKDFDVVKV